MNLIFYLAIERIPIGLAVTHRPITGRCFGSKRFVDYYLCSCSSRNCFDRPWTNNGINVLESYLLCWRALLAFYIVQGKVSK
jgi:inner membrane transporter RhtA